MRPLLKKTWLNRFVRAYLIADGVDPLAVAAGARSAQRRAASARSRANEEADEQRYINGRFPLLWETPEDAAEYALWEDQARSMSLFGLSNGNGVISSAMGSIIVQQGDFFDTPTITDGDEDQPLYGCACSFCAYQARELARLKAEASDAWPFVSLHELQAEPQPRVFAQLEAPR